MRKKKKKKQCEEIHCAYRKRQLMARWHQIRLACTAEQPPVVQKNTPYVCLIIHTQLRHVTYVCFGDLNRFDMPKKAPNQSLNHGRRTSIPTRPRHRTTLHRRPSAPEPGACAAASRLVQVKAKNLAFADRYLFQNHGCPSLASP